MDTMIMCCMSPVSFGNAWMFFLSVKNQYQLEKIVSAPVEVLLWDL